MPDIDFIRTDIGRRRAQVGRQRQEILALQRAGIPTASAEALLARMLDKIDELCSQRDQLKAVSQSGPLQAEASQEKALGGRQ